MKYNQLSQQNANLQAKLDKSHQRYYQSLLFYVRFFSLFVHETEIESELLGILYRLLDGQKKGKSGQATFQMNPKILAYQLTQAQKLKPKSLLHFLCVVTFWLVIALCVPVLLIPHLQLNVGGLLLAVAYIWGFGWLVTRPFMMRFFLRLPTWATIVLTVLLWLILFYPLILFPIISPTTTDPIGFSRLIRFVVLALIIILILGVYLYREKHQTHKKE
ncbi:DUF1129 domain-containing protein [Fructilactobacillus cliffordii]|uniref:DUF1129 domain-containing protein n=1 Tax=Fructilactobacillus cliffordii TaxID=2940299 RepID=UPI002093CF37|nr:DUF1129 domain-containing protein [Fructilactobacillus cliffordii]USS86123.1 DUF1129 domain-containing protein [Fructilactobacillus cliffordii]